MHREKRAKIAGVLIAIVLIFQFVSSTVWVLHLLKVQLSKPVISWDIVVFYSMPIFLTLVWFCVVIWSNRRGN